MKSIYEVKTTKVNLQQPKIKSHISQYAPQSDFTIMLKFLI